MPAYKACLPKRWKPEKRYSDLRAPYMRVRLTVAYVQLLDGSVLLSRIGVPVILNPGALTI